MIVSFLLVLTTLLLADPVGSTANSTDDATTRAPRPRSRRSRIRKKCAPELLSLDPKRETAVTFAKHAQTLCNTSSPWAEEHANVREVLGFVAPWSDHGYKAASYVRDKLTVVSPLWFRVLPGRDEQASSAYEITGMEIADAPEQKRWKARIGTAAHVDLLPHFSIEGFQKLAALKAIMEAPEELAAEIAVTCEHGKFDGVVFDLRSVLFRSLKPLVPRLVKALSGALHASERRLFISVPAGGGVVEFTAVDALAVASYVDAVVVGTRDFSREARGPSAPLPWIRASVRQLLGSGKSPGVRPEQVILEIPLYGRAFPEADENGKAVSKASGGGGGKVILVGELTKALAKQRPAFAWDEEAMEHSANISSKGSRVSLALPTLAFVAERLRLAKALGVGVALRDLGSGMDVAFDLLPRRPDSGDSIEDHELDGDAQNGGGDDPHSSARQEEL